MGGRACWRRIGRAGGRDAYSASGRSRSSFARAARRRRSRRPSGRGHSLPRPGSAGADSARPKCGRRWISCVSRPAGGPPLHDCAQGLPFRPRGGRSASDPKYRRGRWALVPGCHHRICSRRDSSRSPCTRGSRVFWISRRVARPVPFPDRRGIAPARRSAGSGRAFAGFEAGNARRGRTASGRVPSAARDRRGGGP